MGGGTTEQLIQPSELPASVGCGQHKVDREHLCSSCTVREGHNLSLLDIQQQEEEDDVMERIKRLLAGIREDACPPTPII